MRVFQCECGAPVFFENDRCLRCQRELGFLPDRQVLTALEPADAKEQWKALAAGGEAWRKCGNYAREGVCNWMVRPEDTSPLCVSCRLNETIPNLAHPNNRSYWAKLEVAKRRLVYSILRLGLPLKSRAEDPTGGLAFAFLAPAPDGPRVMTGHTGGLITINVAEADDVEREQMRMEMHEAYRTLLGHFRHEIGHYYFDTLVRDTSWHARFRRLFGDETRDYGTSLDAYYKTGAPPDWQSRFISVYASSHPLEDWAETWGHYLHIVDTIETARAFGIGRSEEGAHLIDAHLFGGANRGRVSADFMRLLRDWVWLTLATNAINRSLGMADASPFVLNAGVAEKLGLVHELVTSFASGAATGPRGMTDGRESLAPRADSQCAQGLAVAGSPSRAGFHARATRRRRARMTACRTI
jgi:hypothetical protein